MEDGLLLEVNNLRTHFFLDEGVVKAVDGVDFSVKRGSMIGIVGESGCGKSITALSILKLVSKPGKIVDGEIVLRHNGEHNIGQYGERSAALRSIRGNVIAMIFQEPMNSLSPVHTIGNQIMEPILYHQRVSKKEARTRAIELLRQVGIPKPEDRVDAYTFQLSGGMRQRAMIAMALACDPVLLIADEPTTALDVTTQAQILDLIRTLQEERGMSVMLITHDLGVVAETCDEVAVMYLGEVVEQSDVESLFSDPLHPYTRALLRSIPKLGAGYRQPLNPIRGTLPDPFNRPTGCPYHQRCDEMIPGVCDQMHPELIHLPDGRKVRCVLYEDSVNREETATDGAN